MSKKTRGYWIGAIMVVLGIIGLIGVAFGLITPKPFYSFALPLYYLTKLHFAPMVLRVTAILIGAVILLVIGVYMIKRKIKTLIGLMR